MKSGDDGVWMWDLTWISDGVCHVVDRKTNVVQRNCRCRRAHDPNKAKICIYWKMSSASKWYVLHMPFISLKCVELL